MEANNLTRIEFLAGEPDKPSWWRDVYNKKGMEVGDTRVRPFSGPHPRTHTAASRHSRVDRTHHLLWPVRCCRQVHHMGYQVTEQIWPAVQRFAAAGLGHPVQWARWGVLGEPTAGCYVYVDSQTTLGVTTEVLANGHYCDSLRPPPALNSM